MQYCSECVISRMDCGLILKKKKERRKKKCENDCSFAGISQNIRYTVFLDKQSCIRLNSGTYKENEISGMVAKKSSKRHSHN